MNNTTQGREVTPIQRIESMLREDLYNDISSALPKSVPPERFITALVSALPEKLTNAIASDRLTAASFRQEVIKAALDGMMLDGREAVLNASQKNFAVYPGKDYHPVCQYMPMAHGMIQKMYQAGMVKGLRSSVVYKNDTFRHIQGDDERIEHEATVGPRGPLVAAYAIATLKDGEKIREVMSEEDMLPIMKSSNTVKKDDKKQPIIDHDTGRPVMSNGPWKNFEAEMWRKSVIRRIMKRLPRAESPELHSLLAHDDATFDMNLGDEQVDSSTGETRSGGSKPSGLAKLTPKPESGAVDQKHQLSQDKAPEPEHDEEGDII